MWQILLLLEIVILRLEQVKTATLIQAILIFRIYIDLLSKYHHESFHDLQQIYVNSIIFLPAHSAIKIRNIILLRFFSFCSGVYKLFKVFETWAGYKRFSPSVIKVMSVNMCWPLAYNNMLLSTGFVEVTGYSASDLNWYICHKMHGYIPTSLSSYLLIKQISMALPYLILFLHMLFGSNNTPVRCLIIQLYLQ